MSMRKNGYEQKLVNRWQCYVTKSEAENFLRRLREELYGDPYTQIRSIHNDDGTSEMPGLPKWAKEAFNGKLPYNDAEIH